MSQQDPYSYTPGQVPPTGDQPAYSPQTGQQPGYGGPVAQPYQAYGQAPAPAYGSPQGYAAAGYQAPAQPGTDTFAIVSLILGIVGVGLGAVIFGHLSLKRIAQTGAQGRGMAIAGLVLGYLGMLIGVAYVVFIFALGTSGALDGY